VEKTIRIALPGQDAQKMTSRTGQLGHLNWSAWQISLDYREDRMAGHDSKDKTGRTEELGAREWSTTVRTDRSVR
jgi:hypothetical protein